MSRGKTGFCCRFEWEKRAKLRYVEVETGVLEKDLHDELDQVDTSLDQTTTHIEELEVEVQSGQ